MIFITHTSRDSFFWNSSLSDERKDQIIEWLASLDENSQSIVVDLLNDVRDDAIFDATYEG